jgi:hypothetical protein
LLSVLGVAFEWGAVDRLDHRGSNPLIGFRRELLRYLASTSEERARLIGELSSRKPAIADLVVDLEADDDLRSRFEMQLLRSLRS